MGTSVRYVDAMIHREAGDNPLPAVLIGNRTVIGAREFAAWLQREHKLTAARLAAGERLRRDRHRG